MPGLKQQEYGSRKVDRNENLIEQTGTYVVVPFLIQEMDNTDQRT